jgi:hypothetical protein
MTDSDAPRWLTTWAIDVRPYDRVRIDGQELNVIGRYVPPFTSPLLRIRYPGGVKTIGKLSRIEIFDPDGSVARRVQLVLDWRSP